MPHLLHATESSRVPQRFVFLDTEAHRKRVAGGEVQTWRLGVTSCVTWRHDLDDWAMPAMVDHDMPAGLWAAVIAHARPNCRTVVVAHNLGYDLRIADGLALLAANGWELEKLSLSAGHVGFDAVKDRLRLVFVDSLTVLPVGLGRLGEMCNRPKLPLPDETASDEEHYARCRKDVEILRESYLYIVDALRERDIGCWARTGASIGWSTFVRRHLDEKVFVHGDDELREVEREACYAGRTEVWRHGLLAGGQWHEWDAELAYAHVLSDESLPAYYVDKVIAPPTRYIAKTYGPWRYLCHATVSQPVPVLPTSDAHGFYHPVGTMTGWWWDVELLEAERAGAVVTIDVAHRYAARKWLETWANWIIDLVDDQRYPDTRILALAAKHWQRSLVGRSAMRYSDWTDMGDAFTSETLYQAIYDLDDGRAGTMFQCGGQRFVAWERKWWDQALPQLLSSVMAHCRVRLWRAMTIAGLDHVAYTDTDSLIVDAVGHKALEASADAGELHSLRHKGVIKGVTIKAPRWVEGTGYVRRAGVPKGAERRGESKFSGEVWEGFGESIAEGHPAAVVVSAWAGELSAVDWRRRHLAGGRTEAFTVCDGVRVDETEATG